MIVKDIARAKAIRGKTVSAGAAQRAKTRVIVDILRYVTADGLGLERTPEEGTTKKERAYEQSLTQYLLTEKPASHGRVGALVACWSGEEEVDAEEFLERSLFAMANVDPSHFRHHVFSERHADVELVARARGGHGNDRPWARGVTVDELMCALRDLYGEHAGIMVVEHIDTDHRHFHVIVVTVDPESGKGFQINGGFDRDALHMLAARIDFETGAQSEPNALFVADEDGIHDRWTGRRIADLTLNIDGKATQSVRYQRSELMDQHDAIDKVPGWRERIEEALEFEQPLPEPPAWDDGRIAKIMVRPRITSARSWQALHKSLASIGIAYERAGGGARLEFGDGSHIKATAAVSTASLTELGRRLGPFEPRDENVTLRPFVRPTFTMVKSEELERKHRSTARLAAKEERLKIKAKRQAAQAAIEAEEECEEPARREALRRLFDIEQAALDEWQPPRRPHERRQTPRQAEECEEAIIWSDRAAQFSSLASVKMHYTRQHFLGMVTWSRNGRNEIYEHRRHLSIEPKADKRQVLRLAHSKWGEDFEITGTRRVLHEYTRLAAEEGIFFGDAEQRARISAEQEAQKRKLNLPDLIMLMNLRANRAKVLAEKLVLQQKATFKRWLKHLAEARQRRRDREIFERRFGAAAVDAARRMFQPEDQRAMRSFLAVKDRLRTELIYMRGRRPSAKSAILVEATRERPRDIHSTELQVRMMAEALRQEAERNILLRWLATGRIHATWDDKLITKPQHEWVNVAWERETQNPQFLRAINRQDKPHDRGDDPDIAALAMVLSTNYYGRDMRPVRAILAKTVRSKHGAQIDSAAYTQLLRNFDGAAATQFKKAVLRA